MTKRHREAGPMGRKPVNRRKRYRARCFSGKQWSPLRHDKPRFQKSTRPHGVR